MSLYHKQTCAYAHFNTRTDNNKNNTKCITLFVSLCQSVNHVNVHQFHCFVTLNTTVWYRINMPWQNKKNKTKTNCCEWKAHWRTEWQNTDNESFSTFRMRLLQCFVSKFRIKEMSSRPWLRQRALQVTSVT